MTDSTNTAPEVQKPVPGKPFVKGDPRINRKGRPKSFDQLRALAQMLANEPALDEKGQQIVMDGHVVTNAEMLMRAMMKENPERFVEISYGKVPQPLEVAGKGGGAITLALVKGYAIVSPEDFPALDATESKPE